MHAILIVVFVVVCKVLGAARELYYQRSLYIASLAACNVCWN